MSTNCNSHLYASSFRRALWHHAAYYRASTQATTKTKLELENNLMLSILYTHASCISVCGISVAHIRVSDMIYY